MSEPGLPTHGYQFREGRVQMCFEGPLTRAEQEAVEEYLTIMERERHIAVRPRCSTCDGLGQVPTQSGEGWHECPEIRAAYRRALPGRCPECKRRGWMSPAVGNNPGNRIPCLLCSTTGEASLPGRPS